MYAQEYTNAEIEEYTDAILKKEYNKLFPWGVDDLLNANITIDEINSIFDFIKTPFQIVPELKKLVINKMSSESTEKNNDAFIITKFLAESGQYISLHERMMLYSEATQLSINLWKKEGYKATEFMLYINNNPVKVLFTGRDFTKRPTVIILHGLSGSKLSKKDLTKNLVEHELNVIRFDIQGHGERLDPMRESIVEDTKEIIKQILKLDLIDPENVFILGHSLGGFLTLAMISKMNIFRGAIAIAGFIDRKTGTRSEKLSTIQKRTIRFITQCHNDNHEELPCMPDYHIKEKELESSKTPLFVIHSEDDNIVPVNNVKLIQKIRPDAKYLILPNGGHILQGQWEQVMKQILEFIKNNKK